MSVKIRLTDYVVVKREDMIKLWRNADTMNLNDISNMQTSLTFVTEQILDKWESMEWNNSEEKWQKKQDLLLGELDYGK